MKCHLSKAIIISQIICKRSHTIKWQGINFKTFYYFQEKELHRKDFGQGKRGNICFLNDAIYFYAAKEKSFPIVVDSEQFSNVKFGHHDAELDSDSTSDSSNGRLAVTSDGHNLYTLGAEGSKLFVDISNANGEMQKHLPLYSSLQLSPKPNKFNPSLDKASEILVAVNCGGDDVNIRLDDGVSTFYCSDSNIDFMDGENPTKCVTSDHSINWSEKRETVLMRSMRWHPKLLSYKFKIPNGYYYITLTFCELTQTSRKR